LWIAKHHQQGSYEPDDGNRGQIFETNDTDIESEELHSKGGISYPLGTCILSLRHTRNDDVRFGQNIQIKGMVATHERYRNDTNPKHCTGCDVRPLFSGGVISQEHQNFGGACRIYAARISLGTLDRLLKMLVSPLQPCSEFCILN
jgi:hypothetical protein